MIRNTSLDAYNTIKENGLLSKRRFEVYQILFKYGPLTAHEVVEKARLKYPLSNQTSFNARLSELAASGCVDIVGSKINHISGVENNLWDVNKNIPRKIIKPKIIKCEHCNGKGFFQQDSLL